jgi:transcriptional regulator with XRE-family HTH domain
VSSPDQYAKHRSAIIQFLAEERKKRGISKYQIEQRAGISQQMVGYVESAAKNPSLETMLRIAGGIGVNLGDVIKKTVPKK